MASSSAPVHPYRYLALFLVLLIGVYLLVFLTGDKHAKPKLGIDLQGGTRVTLTARTPDGSRPTRDALNQAQQIISARVNGLGVSGSEVVIDGDNLVITVPGNDGNEARNLGQTARLFIRPVIGQPIPVEAIKQQEQQAAAQRGGPGGPPPGAPPGAAPAAPAPENPASPAPQPRPYPLEPTPNPGEPTPGQPAPAPAPGPGDQAPPTAAPAPQAPGQPAPPPGPPDPRKDLAARIKFEKELRQSSNQNLLLLAVQYMASKCDQEDVLAGNDDPNLPLVTCSQDHKYIYVLDKSIISGDQIKNASSGFDQQSGAYVVDVEFKDNAATTWADFTAANIGTQTAFTLDSQVVS
ncbi:MAG TPA: protein translocase subunit SecD, partial [Mycobacterium sp.]